MIAFFFLFPPRQAKLEGRSLLAPEPEETGAGDTSVTEEDAEEGGEEGAVTKKGEPTHWKLLDPKSMKVSWKTHDFNKKIGR